MLGTSPITYGTDSKPYYLYTGSYTYLTTNTDDPILNGPLRNLRNQYLGDDVLQTAVSIMGTMPLTAVTLATRSAEGVFALRHISKLFVWTGDGGFIGTAAQRVPTYTGTSGPIETTNPTALQGYSNTNSQGVYNGRFAFNF